jgi:hypothetical protein
MPLWFRLGRVRYLALGLFLLLTPAALHAQPKQANPPPVAPPLAREGDFAIRLESVLGVGTSGDEIEAETTLGNLGITPRNGWIADYPVTPDVIAELQKSVGDVANSGRLPVNKEEALKRFHSLTTEINLPITPYSCRGRRDILAFLNLDNLVAWEIIKLFADKNFRHLRHSSTL